MNSVNWSEIDAKSPTERRCRDWACKKSWQRWGSSYAALSVAEGQKAAELYPLTKTYGLSLGDRACLATASVLSGIAVTAENVWTKAEHGVPVRVIR